MEKRSKDKRKSVTVIANEELSKRLKKADEEENIVEKDGQEDSEVGGFDIGYEHALPGGAGSPPFSPIPLDRPLDNVLDSPKVVHNSLQFGEVEEIVVQEKDLFSSNNEDIEQRNEEEEVNDSGESVEGDEEEIIDEQQRTINELLEQQGSNCDEFDDTIPITNVSLYVTREGEDDSEDPNLSNAYFDQGYNQNKISRVNQDKHFLRERKELIEGIFVFFISSCLNKAS